MNTQTTSVWEGTANESAGYSRFAGQQECDVVIIGGGISGLTTALLLADTGLKVIVLEARKIGLGTTGNSTGNLYVTVDEHLSRIRKKWNSDVMKSVVASRRAAMNLIESNVQKYSIDCAHISTSFNYFAEKLDKDSEKFIEEEYDALNECGLNPEIKNDPAFAFPVKRILSVSAQAQFHPLNYCLGLAKQISSKCAIYENSQVIDFDDEKGIVKTTEGTIKAQHIVMATHIPKGNFALHAMLGPYREFGVAAPLEGSDFPQGIFWGVNQPKHSVRTYPSGGQKYIMVIGDKFKTGQHGDTDKYISGLEDFLKERFKSGSFDYVWGGQQYRPADGLPYIGKHGERIWMMTGFATDGLVYGTLAAMIVSDQIKRKENEWEDLYKAGRFTPVKSAAQIIKENVDNFGEYMKDTPWNADAFSLDKIKTGEGKIVETHGEKLAVYKDAAGEAHVVSAVCTHMKCIVNWNDAEKSWDCPCHGSRFNYRGEIIEGPALTNLPVKTFKKEKS
jgi:glycine/D-amino acid oxidase-like deaminating enzyme/nitrite reductase/ring-hydroxylating ferredoxin subunit